MSTEDTPHIPLYGRWTRVNLKEDFRMYIMWHPRGAIYEQRIPLQRVEWSWEVTVENQSGTGADWKIVKS